MNFHLNSGPFPVEEYLVSFIGSMISVASDLGIQCLPMTVYGTLGINGLEEFLLFPSRKMFMISCLFYCTPSPFLKEEANYFLIE